MSCSHPTYVCQATERIRVKPCFWQVGWGGVRSPLSKRASAARQSSQIHLSCRRLHDQEENLSRMLHRSGLRRVRLSTPQKKSSFSLRFGLEGWVRTGGSNGKSKGKGTMRGSLRCALRASVEMTDLGAGRDAKDKSKATAEARGLALIEVEAIEVAGGGAGPDQGQAIGGDADEEVVGGVAGAEGGEVGDLVEMSVGN